MCSNVQEWNMAVIMRKIAKYGLIGFVIGDIWLAIGAFLYNWIGYSRNIFLDDFRVYAAQIYISYSCKDRLREKNKIYF